MQDTAGADWRNNNGASGLITLFTDLGLGFHAVSYDNTIAAGKEGGLITPISATLPMDAIRLQWSSGSSCGADSGQQVRLYKEA